MELIVVVIIVGILAMIGLPQFFKVAERGRAAEALAAIGSYRNAQLRYAAEHQSTTDNITRLDVDVPALKYFNVTVLGAVDPIATPTGEIVTATRQARDNNYGDYVLHMSANGTITCTGGTSNICNTLGY
jgi:type II secretory pathway pseudopilin PulG